MSFKDEAKVRDTLEMEMRRARDFHDGLGIIGVGVVELWRGPRPGEGRLIHVDSFSNLVTTTGDLYYAAMAIALVTPAAPAQPTKMNGMKLGSGGGTAPSKSGGTNDHLRTYISNSNNPFDSSFPDVVDEAGDTGASARYKTSWLAGDTTAADIDEVVIVNDAGTDATTSAANTISLANFTSINKAAGDSLAITWKHLFLGA